MKKLKKAIKKRYILFIITILLIIIGFLIPVQNSIDSQNSDTYVINTSAKQRYLVKSINHLVHLLDLDSNQSKLSKLNTINELQKLVNTWKHTHDYLHSINIDNEKNTVLDSLCKVTDVSYEKILNASNAIINNPSSVKDNIKIISKNEPVYFKNMDALVMEYEKAAEKHFYNLKLTIYFLACIPVLILIFEFVFILLPVFNKTINKNDELVKINKEIASSREEIIKRMEEVSKLKANLEIQQNYNKIFIDQAPTAIAMLDNNMVYMAVSQRWIKDYKMQGQQIIGCSHYDIFPEIGEDWKEKHRECLNGAIDRCDKYPFRRADGSVQWIYWDVRPWYNFEGQVGGLLMHTGDITEIVEKENEKTRIEEILEKTNKVARIGTWELDLATDRYILSDVACEILKVPKDFFMNRKINKNFYKDGYSKDLIIKSMNACIDYQIPFDLELEAKNLEGEDIWIREIAYSEFEAGKCVKVYGIFQDITSEKQSQNKLFEVNNELNTILNSGSVAIVSTDNCGIIKHFNQGAELLLGYSASEMIGIERPEIYVVESDIQKFTEDIARLYGKNPNDFDPYLELSIQKKSDSREWTYIRKDGSTVSVYSTLTAINDKNGKKIGFLGVAIDISERKAVEDELLRKNELLVSAEKITMMGHWQWDAINNKSKWSSNLYEILGYKEELKDITAESYIECIHPDDKQFFMENLQKSIEDKQHYPIFHRIISKDGKIKTIHVLGKIITNDEGEVIGLIGTCQDVTEQKMAENKFKGLLESAPDATVIINEHGDIQLINKQAEKLFGYHFEDLANKSIKKLIPENLNNNHKLFYANNFFLDKETIRMGEIRELTGENIEGKNIPIQISLSPLETENGLLISVAIRDITTQNLARLKILKAKHDLEILTKTLIVQNNQLADFAHITSHNLRAPVSNLNSLLNFYKASEDNEEKNILFEKFEFVINHLTLTLNTLVEAIKTKNDDKENLENIPFDDVLNKTKGVLSGEILKTQAVIESDFSKAKNINFKKVYLESIFLNLVENAIKYKHPDRNPKIAIKSLINKEGKIELRITDNGLGINMDRHGDKLFGLNKTFHRHPEAKGVGLFMTKTQIQAMGGTITALSELNKGTTFIIIF
ncbi:PAS domain S-box protein [Confluentibacter sediminis]|uniref:PAS domain S-box protein n=1 Tax=Confluentibacter sediminis TaxID=2219045 RepID=UPI000DAB9388|nr:PAS domain S-box protein [Confluentibacter sediminis]